MNTKRTFLTHTFFRQLAAREVFCEALSDIRLTQEDMKEDYLGLAARFQDLAVRFQLPTKIYFSREGWANRLFRARVYAAGMLDDIRPVPDDLGLLLGAWWEVHLVEAATGNDVGSGRSLLASAFILNLFRETTSIQLRTALHEQVEPHLRSFLKKFPTNKGPVRFLMYLFSPTASSMRLEHSDNSVVRLRLSRRRRQRFPTVLSDVVQKLESVLAESIGLEGSVRTQVPWG